MLYRFGSNGSGQLGLGHAEDLSIPTAVDNIGPNSSWQVKQLAAGGNHTVILCNDGRTRATGNNEDGRCGIEGSVQQAMMFLELELPSNQDRAPLEVKQVAASWSSTALLCNDGKIYVCGSGNSGELGLGLDVANAPSLRPVPDFPPSGTDIIFLASGMAHTVVVLSNGEVYGWGKGRKGQLGHPAHNVWWPRKITGIDFGATKAACGRDFTFLVGEPFTGQMVVLGPDGNDRFGIKADAPVALPGWRNIAASWCSIYALKAAGDVVAWGRDDRGQLPPKGLPEIEAIAAGSEHCLALTRAGKVLAWGWGEHGNCGQRTDEKSDVKPIWNEIYVTHRVSGVFAGCATSFIDTEERW